MAKILNILFRERRKLLVLGVIAAAAVILGLILVRFARKAEPVDSVRTAWLRSSLIAHRGIHNDDLGVAENSISAFAGAVEKGLCIELDVSMTKDRQLAVFHDKKLKRMFGVDASVKDLTYQELSKLKFRNSSESIPLFSEVLSFVDGRVPLLIEIKNEDKVGDMEKMIVEQLKGYQGQYAIQSFNPYVGKWFRTNAPQVLRGQLSGSFIISDYDAEYAGTTRLPWHKRFLLSNMLMNFESRPQFIAYEIKHNTSPTFRGLKELGVPLLGWTVDDQAEYQRVRNDFDGFIVNDVSVQ